MVASTRPDSAGENADFRAFSLARPSPAPTAPRPSSRNVAGGPGWKLAQRAAIPPHYAPRSFRAGLPQHFEFGGLNHHLMYWPTALVQHERRGSSVTKTIRIAALPGAPRHQDGAPKVELASAIYIASQRRRNDDRYTTAATTIHESALSQSAQSHQARVSLTPSGLVVGYRIAGTAVPRPAACQVAHRWGCLT